MAQQQAAPPVKSYDVLASIGSNPMQQMAGGGAIGKIKDWAGDLKEKFLGSDLIEPLHKASNKMGIMKDEQYAEIQGYAGGGLPNAGMAQSSMMQAIQPMLQVANEQAQQAMNYSAGGDIINSLKDIAQQSQGANKAFEGKVNGAGDGMSDSIPFNIEGEQPALLARDEYVVPADVVAMVGNGSSNAGADKFDQFLGDVREMKYGRSVQPRETQGLLSLLG